MARNEEKQLGQLNRLYLQKEEEERRRKFPPRPKLHTLHTAADVAKHLTSIIKDIDISIKMSQVTCYTQEASERYLAAADQYRREYEAFVRKLKLLDSSAVVGRQPIPWTDRPYDRKQAAPALAAAGDRRTAKDDVEKDCDGLKPSAGSNDTVPRQTIEASSGKRFCRIESPLLDEECRVQQSASVASAAALGEWVAQTTPSQAVQDAPLQFLAQPSRGWALAAAPAHRPCTTESRSRNVATRSCDNSGIRYFCPSAGVQSSSDSDSRSWQCTDGPVQLQAVNAVASAMPIHDSLDDRGCHSGLAQLRQLYGDEDSSLDGESSDGEAET